MWSRKGANRYSYCLLLVLTCLVFSGCFSSEEGFNSAEIVGSSKTGGDGNPDFPGCISGAGTSTSSVQINYSVPGTAVSFTVSRNGATIFSTASPGNGSVADTGLVEGQTYTYMCSATFANGKSKIGTKTLTVGPLSVNPPTFAGIVSATTASSSSVNITWNPATGVPAGNYKVWATPGSTVDFGAAPALITGSGSFSATVTGLGDEMPYAFGVRACSTAGNCDTNTASQTATTSDGGAPLTVGATTASPVNGNIEVTAPWDHTKGAVKKRYVYQKTGGAGTTNLADYTLIQTLVVADLANPSTTLTISSVSDNTTYHYIIVDEGPSLANNGNRAFVTVNSGDLTAPTFLGITALINGSPTDTVLRASFTAIDHEGIDPVAGASQYVIYTASAAYPTAAPDACTSGTEFQQLTASAYTTSNSYDVDLTGLTPRTNYSVCIKARDSAGNHSAGGSNTPMTATTLDITAPQFDGVQTITYNLGTQKLDVAWNASSSSDIKHYKVRFWKNVYPPTAPDITDFIKTHASYPTGYSFPSSEYTFGSNDVVYVIVDVCDDADTLPGGAENCTSVAVSTNKNVTLPDTDPPAGFVGIKPAVNQVSSAEGEMTVTWFEPAWTADYAGFKIYRVLPDDSITLMKTCSCAIPGACITADTTCTVTGLNAYRTYKMHVRAFDAIGNETTYLNPATNNASKQTIDTTAPTFASGLTIGSAPTFQLTWTAASDNQYDTALIDYKVYRKVNATFGDPNNPAADGSLRTTTNSTDFTDSGFIEGDTYYFAVCASDQSNNTTCDGVVKNFTAPDITPPVISNLSTAKTNSPELKKWDLTWSMSDNASATGNLLVKIYQKNTASPDTATTSDTIVFTNFGSLTATDLTGPVDVNNWVNYLVVVEDEASNTASATISVESKNAMTITAIKRATGSTAGGQLVSIQGTGFSNHKSGYKTTGRAAAFNGTDNEVTIAGGTGSDTLTSFEAWVYPTSATAMNIVSGNSIYLRLRLNNYFLETYDGGAYRATSVATTPNAWNHVAMTFNGTTKELKMFVNGSLGYSNTGAATYAAGAINRIGRVQAGADWFLGSIDEVVLYDRILLDNEVIHHHNAGLQSNWAKVIKGSKPKAWWRFDESAGATTAVDQMGSYDATCVDCPTFQSASDIHDGYGTTVTIGGSACTNVIVASSTSIACITPARAASFADVVVTNPEGSSKTLSSGFEYEATPSHICDNPGSWGTDFASGDGLGAGTAYTICNSTHLDMLRNNLGENGALANYRTGNYYFKLGDNIDLSGVNFDGIGAPAGDASTQQIDGDGHVIANWTNFSTNTRTGMFLYSNSSVYSNLGIVNAYITVTGGGNAGIFSGLLSGSSSYNGVFSSGSVYSSFGANAELGGLVGVVNNGAVTISNSYSTADVNAKFARAGGLIGYASNVDSIDNCYASGDVRATDIQIGGLVGLFGRAQTGLSNSYATGNVTSTGGQIGGLIGRSGLSAPGVSISNSYATGNVVVGGTYAGGLVGYLGTVTSGADITSSYATGNVTSTSNTVGGLVGNAAIATTAGSITQSYATGDVSGTNSVGGLVGSGTNAGVDITSSYATGNVTGSTNNIGGLVGNLGAGVATNTITGSYATGNVVGTGAGVYYGGLVGNSTSMGVNISKSYATGNITNNGDSMGGLIGRAVTPMAISESYATGNITGDGAASDAVGGLIGIIYGYDTQTLTIQDNYATGAVQGANELGGLIGRIYVGTGETTATIIVRRNYSTGEPTGSTNIGGLVGICNPAGGEGVFTINNNFWDTDTSTEATAIGSETNNCAGTISGGSTGNTTSAMKAQSVPGANGIYGAASWDFGTPIWKWNGADGTVYPVLDWQ